MPLFFLGTREWRNRQTRTVQVRVPVMEWGFNSPLAHDETADPSGSAVFVFPGCGRGVAVPVLGYRTLRVAVWRWLLLVAPRVFWSPGPAAVCAGGRRPAREPSVPRDSLGAADLEVRPGPAAAHGHRSQALRRPPHRRRLVADVLLGALLRSQAGSRASTCSLSSVSHAIP